VRCGPRRLPARCATRRSDVRIPALWAALVIAQALTLVLAAALDSRTLAAAALVLVVAAFGARVALEGWIRAQLNRR
jgi:hypothetical protein